MPPRNNDERLGRIDNILRNIHTKQAPTFRAQIANEATQATFTADVTFFNRELFRNLIGDFDLGVNVLYVNEVEPKDVDPDEFEKILNGG